MDNHVSSPSTAIPLYPCLLRLPGLYEKVHRVIFAQMSGLGAYLEFTILKREMRYLPLPLNIEFALLANSCRHVVQLVPLETVGWSTWRRRRRRVPFVTRSVERVKVPNRLFPVVVVVVVMRRFGRWNFVDGEDQNLKGVSLIRVALTEKADRFPRCRGLS